MPELEYPKDANNVTFDPAKHNLLNKTAMPQLSKAGNFVALKKDQINPKDILDQYHTILETKAAEMQPTEEPEGFDLSDIVDDEEPVAETAPVADIADILDDEDPLDIEEGIDDEIDIMAEDINGDAADFAPLDLDKKTIIKSVQLAINSANTSDRANFSNGGSEANRFRGEGYSLKGIDLSGENLRSAVFNDCDLEGAYFIGANLDGAIFKGASLRNAILPQNFKDVAVFDDDEQLRKAVIDGA